MACSNNQFFLHLHHHFAIYLLILVISASTSTIAQGRMLPHSPQSSKKVIADSAIFRPQIGSRPPQCERRCSSCAHCEAVQVPTNPTGTRNSTTVSAVAYARDEESSNYKPMSWKCKCGDLIFNP